MSTDRRAAGRLAAGAWATRRPTWTWGTTILSSRTRTSSRPSPTETYPNKVTPTIKAYRPSLMVSKPCFVQPHVLLSLCPVTLPQGSQQSFPAQREPSRVSVCPSPSHSSSSLSYMLLLLPIPKLTTYSGFYYDGIGFRGLGLVKQEGKVRSELMNTPQSQ